jgi:hypothetical protein
MTPCKGIYRIPFYGIMYDMKLCVRCNTNPATVQKGHWCPPCKRLYDREYWAKTKHLRNKRKKINVAAIRLRNMKYVWQYLLDHPCRCGETDPIVLQFDHTSDKVKNISDMLSSHSLDTIKKEIVKCVVRCAHCHLRRTAVQYDWYKYLRAVAQFGPERCVWDAEVADSNSASPT